MTEYNKEKKDTLTFLEKLSSFLYNKEPGFLLTIISGFLGSLACCFILFIAYEVIGYTTFYYDCFFDLKWHIIYPPFLGIGIGIFVSLGIRKSRYSNKKNIIILIVLCLFLTYIFFDLTIYIKYIMPYHGPSILSFPKYTISFITGTPLRFDYPYGLDLNRSHTEMYKYTEPVLQFFHTITFDKLDRYKLSSFINLLVWIFLFFVSYLCAWFIVKFNITLISSKEAQNENEI